MTLSELSSLLVQHREKPFRLQLPNGDGVPVSFHITEAGHVSKKFIDCGGRVHRKESCLLQAWVGDDDDHRIVAGKLLGILGKARITVLPDHADELPVEIEYEDTVLSHYHVSGSTVDDGAVVLRLQAMHTDCLAKDVCLSPAPGEAAACCGGKC